MRMENGKIIIDDGDNKSKIPVGHFSNNTNIRYHVFSIYSVIVTVLMVLHGFSSFCLTIIL